MTSGVACGLLPGESGSFSLPRSRRFVRGGGTGFQHILTFLALPKLSVTWVTHPPSVSPSFLICKMGTVISPSIYCTNIQ